MSYRILWLVIATTLVVLPAFGCKSTRPKPSDYAELHTPVLPSSVAEPTRARTTPSVDEWVCPMHAQVKSSEPGQCSICGMDLVRSGDSSGARESGSGHSHSSGSGHKKHSGSGCGHCG